MLYATEVTTQDELIQINKLNQKNLATSLSQKEKDEQGFLTWLYPVSLLQKIHNIAPSVIVKDDDKVVGYALVTPKEVSTFHTDLKEMIKNIELLTYKEKPISSYKFYIMGQVCIDKEYRGKGIFNTLFKKHKELYKDVYELLITEISTRNFRSQKAHEKVGFKTIHTYIDDLGDWNAVVWDWK